MPKQGIIIGESCAEGVLNFDNQDHIAALKGERSELFHITSSTDREGKLCLDIIFVPFGLNKALAQNEILKNYVLRHLEKSDFAATLASEVRYT